VPELQKSDVADAATSRSKRSVDKGIGDDKKSRKDINAPKPAKGRVKVAKGSSNKAGMLVMVAMRRIMKRKRQNQQSGEGSNQQGQLMS